MPEGKARIRTIVTATHTREMLDRALEILIPRRQTDGDYRLKESPVISAMTRSAKTSSTVKITISKENYLKTIAEAESEGEVVKAATLARWLNVPRPP